MFVQLEIKDKSGQTIIFEAHELLWVLHQLTQMKLNNVKEKEALEPIKSIIPNYRYLTSKFNQRLDHFLKDIICRYEQRYKLTRKQIHTFLSEMEVVCRENPFQILSTFMKYQTLLEHIKSLKRKHPDYAPLIAIQRDILGILPIPPIIRNLHNIEIWMYLSNHIGNKKKVHSHDLDWWLHVGDRLILINNHPRHRHNRYASDHGKFIDVIQNAIRFIRVDNTDDSRALSSSVYNFYQKYSQFNDGEKEKHEQRFIQAIINLNPEETTENMLLRALIGCCFKEKICHTIINEKRYVLTRDHSLFELHEYQKELHSPFSNEESKAGDLNQDNLYLVRLWYKWAIDRASLISRRFFLHAKEHMINNMGAFFTQTSNVFHQDDASIFLNYYIHAQTIRKLAAEGRLDNFPRPLSAYADRDEGNSYM